MSDLTCDGCSAPIEPNEFRIVYQPYGYSAHHFCHPSCLQDWRELGCPGQVHLLYEEAKESKPTGFWKFLWKTIIKGDANAQ
jgi:hypothetical protein